MNLINAWMKINIEKDLSEWRRGYKLSWPLFISFQTFLSIPSFKFNKYAYSPQLLYPCTVIIISFRCIQTNSLLHQFSVAAWMSERTWAGGKTSASVLPELKSKKERMNSSQLIQLISITPFHSTLSINLKLALAGWELIKWWNELVAAL